MLARARARALRSILRWQRLLYRVCLTLNKEHYPDLCRSRSDHSSQCDGPWSCARPAQLCTACIEFQHEWEHRVIQAYPKIRRPVRFVQEQPSAASAVHSQSRDRIARNPRNQIPLFGTLPLTDTQYSSSIKADSDIDTSSDESIPSAYAGIVDWLCLKPTTEGDRSMTQATTSHRQGYPIVRPATPLLSSPH